MDKQPNQKTEMKEKTVLINNQIRKQNWKKKTVQKTTKLVNRNGRKKLYG